MKTLRVSCVVVAAVAAMGLNSVMADQPHMRRALEHLRAARAELESAMHNKGGERIRAIETIDRAIHEVQEGMAIAR
jgi:hypothetical protein